jgi:hypothetical protein
MAHGASEGPRGQFVNKQALNHAQFQELSTAMRTFLRLRNTVGSEKPGGPVEAAARIGFLCSCDVVITVQTAVGLHFL